jgi:glycerol-3-phosphate dehydrogenase
MTEQDHCATNPRDDIQDTLIFDVVVIGGGVVGLSILRQATLWGYTACVVERELDLAGWASGSNSGIVCTGVDAPHGSLERALIRESISTVRYHCRAMNVPTREFGSLVCSWTWTTTTTTEGEEGDDDDDDNATKQGDGLDEVLEQSHMAGDAHARRLTPEDVRNMEPALNRHECLGAVHIPGEFVVDPWLYTISLAAHARENGATIFVEFDVDLEGSSFDETNGWWTLVNRMSPHETSRNTPASVRGRSVVNAAGIWSDRVEQKLAGDCDWKAMPRRGQYVVLTDTGLQGERESSLTLTRPIQPVPSLHTKGVFVFSSMYHQIVVGPTATEQSSRDDRSPDPRVRHELLAVARRVLPCLDPYNDELLVVGEYVGIRPATDRRDYQIRLHSRRRWVACAGIRSTGALHGITWCWYSTNLTLTNRMIIRQG